MAIYRLTGDNGLGVDDLVAWLNASKTGTFLENATIIKETTHPLTPPAGTNASYGDTISITKGSMMFRLAFVDYISGYSAVNYPLADLKSSDLQTSYGTMSLRNDQRVATRKGNCMLCKNGLLIGMNVINTYESTTLLSNSCRLCLTVDDNGNLMMMHSQFTAWASDASVAYNNGIAISKTPDYAAYSLTLVPASNFRGTSISNAALFGTDTSSELENVFLASVSQQNVNAEHPEAVTLDGKNYITNGRIYIRDE